MSRVRCIWRHVALAAIVCTAGVLGFASSAAWADSAEPLEVKMMSFNVRYGTASDGADHWDHRHDMVFDIIDRRGGDFVGMQEGVAFQIDEIIEAVPRYASVGVGRDDGERGGEFSNILYDTRRWQLDDAHHGTFWLSDTPDVPGSMDWGNNITRICTWARFIEKDTGRGIYIFNMHWDHRSQNSREKSAELVMERAVDRAHPDEPLVVMGDMNAGEDNPATLYLLGEAEGAPLEMVDTYRVLYPDEEVVGTFNGFEFGRIHGAKIDYILVEPDARVLSADIDRYSRDGHYPSDHFPVTARVRWEN